MARVVPSQIVDLIEKQLAGAQTLTLNVDHGTVCPLMATARLVGAIPTDALDGSPFVVGKFVAYDSKLHFGSLNHRSATLSGCDLLDERAKDLTNQRNFSAHGGHLLQAAFAEMRSGVDGESGAPERKKLMRRRASR
jgi:hypothetical protein